MTAEDEPRIMSPREELFRNGVTVLREDTFHGSSFENFGELPEGAHVHHVKGIDKGRQKGTFVLFDPGIASVLAIKARSKDEIHAEARRVFNGASGQIEPFDIGLVYSKPPEKRGVIYCAAFLQKDGRAEPIRVR